MRLPGRPESSRAGRQANSLQPNQPIYEIVIAKIFLLRFLNAQFEIIVCPVSGSKARKKGLLNNLWDSGTGRFCLDFPTQADRLLFMSDPGSQA